MPKPLENVIIAALPDATRHTVALRWANGHETVSTFAHLIGHGAMKPLQDAAVFDQVSVGARGRSLVFPGDIDFCADALWYAAHPEDLPHAVTMALAAG